MDTPKTVYLCREKNVGWDYSYWNESPMGSENIAYLHADIVAERLDALRAEIAEDLQAVKAPLDIEMALVRVAGRLDTARRDLLGSEAKEVINDRIKR